MKIAVRKMAAGRSFSTKDLSVTTAGRLKIHGKKNPL